MVHTRFKKGKSYKYNFVGDSQLWVTVKVLRRTAKTIWVEFVRDGKQKKTKIHHYDGYEYFYPLGQYSLAPMCAAKRSA